MDILVVIDSKNYAFENVMLISLFENNDININIYALYSMSEINGKHLKKLEKLVDKYDGKIYFTAVDKKEFIRNFSLNDNNFDQELFVLMAHTYLPKEIEKIIYISHDTIITGSLEELYGYDLGTNMLAAGGEHYERTGDQYCRAGARPIWGEIFDTGIILLNVRELNESVTTNTYREVMENADVAITPDLKHILNAAFYNKAVTLNPMIYGFKMNIYERFLRDGYTELKGNTIAIRYQIYDYYKIGTERLTRIMNFSASEQQLLTKVKPYRNVYELKKYWEKNDEIHRLWWDYAGKTDCYYLLKAATAIRKPIYMIFGLELYKPYTTIKKLLRYSKMFQHFKFITENNDELISKYCEDYRYNELEMYIDSLPPDEARQTLENLYEHNCKRMKKNGKVRVAFMVYSSSEWQCETVYRLLEKDDRFEPYILVCKNSNGSEQTVERTYKRTCQYFVNSAGKYNVAVCDPEKRNDRSAEKIVEKSDVFFYFGPGKYLRPTEFAYENRKLRQLLVHVPYGFYLVDKTDVTHIAKFYDKIIFKMSWFYFACDELQKKTVNEQQRMGNHNVVVSGLPKLDTLIEKTYIKRENIWKLPTGKEKKVIWAPHWLLDGSTGTFDKNYMWFYEYAKNHPEISWIVRPHPRLPYSATEKYHVFNDLKEYDEYFAKWNNLPNAHVVPDGDYYDVFDSSDAMILDSISFIAEYQYTGKPLLMLLPENTDSKSEFGYRLMDILYKTKGTDFEKIDSFVNKVVIKEMDYMREERHTFFCNYLDYKRQNGKLASKKIVDTITTEIFE